MDERSRYVRTFNNPRVVMMLGQCPSVSLWLFRDGKSYDTRLYTTYSITVQQQQQELYTCIVRLLQAYIMRSPLRYAVIHVSPANMRNIYTRDMYMYTGGEVRESY